MPVLHAATGDAFARLEERDGRWRAVASLQGGGFQRIAVDPADPATVYAASKSGGLQKSQNGGETWADARLPISAVYSLAVSAADGAVYAGTEPSHLFVSRDGGASWRELEALRDLPSKPEWSFPPRPWTSHVSWIAPSPHDARLLLVGIELGGLMRSEDGGETWQDPPAGGREGRPSAGLASDCSRAGLRSRRWRRGLEPGRRSELGSGRCRARSGLLLGARRASGGPGHLVHLGGAGPAGSA